MARIFSINIDYEGISYPAMITVRVTPFFTEYTVQTDTYIESLLPGTKIISTTSNQLVFANATFDQTTPLMQEVLLAVQLHIQMLIS